VHRACLIIARSQSLRQRRRRIAACTPRPPHSAAEAVPAWYEPSALQNSFLFSLQNQHDTQALAGNDFNEHTCCLFAPFFASAPQLTEVELDKEPFSCIKTGHWQKAGLPLLPDEVAHSDWIEVSKYLCRNGKVLASF
jgi:hypothetical protein